jgi:hypothetical protein
MHVKILACVICFPLLAQAAGQMDKAQAKAEADLRARIAATPALPFDGVHFAAKPPAIGWESGAVSWVSVDAKGCIYEIHAARKPTRFWY